MIMYAIIVFLVGLSVGSFLNVVIYRLDDLKSIISTRSSCPKCKKTLRWIDLIPLLSFITLYGKCRYCKETISWQYPLVEASTAIVFLLLFFKFGLSWALVFFALLFSLLIIVFVYDLTHQLIPEEIVWTGLILTLLGVWYFGGIGVYGMLLGGLVCGGVPAILVLVSKEKWMGAGDIKLGFLVGAMVGYPEALLLLFLSFVLGSIVGLVLIIRKNKKFNDTLAFAPYLIGALLITLFWGDHIINWYLGYVYY